MPTRSHSSRSVTLSLPPDEHWTLHHVLLDRIEQEATEDDDSAADPPPIEVFQAFEALDSGETCFTVAQLRAVETVLADYHHSSDWWEVERPQLERLLHRITSAINPRPQTPDD